VKVSGAKNAALPIMAAAVLSEERSVIENVPPLRDVLTMIRILREFGVKAEMDGDRVTIEPGRYEKDTAPYKLVSTMRASFCVLGPILAKLGHAHVSLPGGCVIGPRPVDLHLKGLRALGAEIEIDGGYVVARAKRLRGARIYLGGAFGSSVLATDNVMAAATLAQGTTTIENAACEPETVDLAHFLMKMGARIRGVGTPIIEVEGVKALHGARHRIIADRVEAGTYLAAAAITGGTVTVQEARIEHLGAVVDKFRQAGVTITATDGAVTAKGPGALRPVDVTTLPYPGFPTDMQAQMLAMMCVSNGISIVTEKIYPDRFMHVSELGRMGAQIALEGPSAIVKGVRGLSGAPVMASDLRASAALVLAGLVGRGRTDISRIYHLDRGYERMEQKLTRLGARIWREKE
jgi:UDP-N-acetylglucosamine 1-carboxyvinyltransferase